MFTPTEQIRRIGEISPHQSGQIYSSDGLAPTLMTGGGSIVKTYKDDEFRRLTPLECERLQGFPGGWTEGVSKTQRYKQLGNSVTVNVIEEIGKKFALLKVK
jgi:DNA (cytosine-5)-methyltransferase 1